MFIDLHCHTKNAKSSESTREVDAATFLTTLQSYGVGIVAITNHNLFCRNQFDIFAKLSPNLLVWPGVELDVIGDKSGAIVRGHVIVISNPKYLNEFDNVISIELAKAIPDDYTISIDNLVTLLNGLTECLVICHYMKKQELSIDDIKFLESSLSDDKIVMLEPANSRKAAIIYYDDEEQAWFGSDVTDWNNYPNCKKDFILPECKFNIQSFEQFFNLLKKNRGTVLANGYLDPKKSDLIHLSVFDDLIFDYQIFNDVNIVFGGKATAKTSILRKIEEYFKSKSKEVSTYYVEQKESDLQNLVVKKPSDALIASFDSLSSKEDLDFFKQWKWTELPTLSLFYKSEITSQQNDLINRLKITKALFSETLLDIDFKEARRKYFDNLKIINSFLNIGFEEYLNQKEIASFKTIIDKIVVGETKKYHKVALEYYSMFMERWTINKIKTRISSANSIIARPSSTGLTSFYSDYAKLKIHLSTLKNNIKYQKEVTPYPVVGSIPFKGNVYRRTLIGFPPQDQSKYKDKTGGGRAYLFGQTKSNYDSLKTTLNGIKLDSSTDDISSSIKKFSKQLDELKINSLKAFLNYSTFLTTNKCNDFLPSNGVTSILLVESALQNDEADVIILDEPDSGMGADFINEDLIVKINNRAKENKIVVIATHDPNLVVRTHPYSCLYREEINNETYTTYVGSSFDEELIDISDENNIKKWVDACVEKCEGGQKALDERIKTYGKR